ncbi:MAG: IPExxxVDY family protein [Maribacter sp.]|nr:IPExxxVDY family protein [Maribacter sp.]
MVAVHKITEDFYEDAFRLIALHSSLEDYAMVYAINHCLKSNFKRAQTDLDLSEQGFFPFFEWNDEINDRFWTLIVNCSLNEVRYKGIDLFRDEPSYTSNYLVPEYKEADYFLKIEADESLNTHTIVKSLFEIPKVMTAYEIQIDKLKSKNNLIF